MLPCLSLVEDVTVELAKEKYEQFKSKYMSDGEWDLINVSSSCKYIKEQQKTLGKIEYIVSMK